ncbi:MAG: hypothetical protein WCJ56_11375, partial [bacterium]
MNFRDFQDPGMKWRPAPFWSINDRLDSTECARQMTDMLDAGMSGAFFHSRSGLVTDYLGEEWFAAMDASLAAAEEGGGFLWLYDEDRWPSGNAGGQITALGNEYCSAFLRAELTPAGAELYIDEDAPTTPRAAFIIERETTGDGLRIKTIRRILVEEISNHKDADRLILGHRYDMKTSYWGGESPANNLNPKSVQKFIEMTHVKYAEHYRNSLGGTVPGIFTDEPQISFKPSEIPWYDGLPDKYMEWTGRNMWEDLPYLFFNGPEDRKIRLLIHRTINRQFAEAFTKQIYDWCEANNMPHTGHFMCEDSLDSQIRYNGGSVMPHYRYEHIPGVDHLCRDTTPMLLTHKQVNSAARQLGRKRVLTEIFGVSRHTNTFADFRWIGDYNLVFGSNFFCPHLTLYSARGRRKRDYPPNWNYQQTYWKELRPLNDYFTRVGDALAAGEAKVDILVLHPMDTATAGHRMAARSNINLPREDYSAAYSTDNSLRRTVDAIVNAGFDCDLGDETFLAEMGSIVDNKLVVGQMNYKIVVAPPAQT